MRLVRSSGWFPCSVSASAYNYECAAEVYELREDWEPLAPSGTYRFIFYLRVKGDYRRYQHHWYMVESVVNHLGGVILGEQQTHTLFPETAKLDSSGRMLMTKDTTYVMYYRDIVLPNDALWYVYKVRAWCGTHPKACPSSGVIELGFNTPQYAITPDTPQLSITGDALQNNVFLKAVNLGNATRCEIAVSAYARNDHSTLREEWTETVEPSVFERNGYHVKLDNMPHGYKYVYKVRARSKTGHQSPWSNEVSVTKHGVAKVRLGPGEPLKDAQVWVKHPKTGLWVQATAYAREDINSDWAVSQSI